MPTALYQMLASIDHMKNITIRLACAFIAIFALAFPAFAEEVIRSFTSNVILSADGTVDVTEIIEVRAEARNIRRGIYRDIPTTMVIENEQGKQVGKLHSNLTVIDILRDGEPEPFFTDKITNARRIYIGQEDVFLSAGIYRYTIHYTMTRMARSFEGYDEIFWNATGNFWDFPIESATATITLPQGAIVGNMTAFTGAFGSTESAVAVTRLNDSTAIFRATRGLDAYEGMSVAVSFPKGVLSVPEGTQRALYFLSDYRDQIFPGVAVFLVLLFYFIVWSAIGRDPKKSTIIPLFNAPEGFSPGLLHYIWAMGWKKSGWQAFTAAMISLGVKGLVEIGKEGKKTRMSVTNEYGETEPLLPAGEAVIYSYLNSKGSVTINTTTGPMLDTKRGQFINAIETENRLVYFKNNFRFVTMGILLSAVCLLALLFSGVLAFEWLFVALFGGGVLGGLTIAFRAIWSRGGVIRFFQLALFGFFMLNFFAGAGAVFESLPEIQLLNSPAIAAVSIITINVMFAILMRAPTIQGRKVMDKIEGFRMYLETAEKERLNFVGEPKLSVSRFEEILPYAIALGVEKPWSERFEGELARNTISAGSKGYHPGWYHTANFSSASIGKDLGSLATGMSAAMIASQPASSSSSGSSGGGSSGGGGGGGGGGGW